MKLPASVLSRLLLSLSVFVLNSVAWGQAGSGEITGQIFDNSGAAIQNARITVTNEANGHPYSTLSASGGVYAFSGLDPGDYGIRVEAPQFAQHTQTGIRLRTGERLRVD